MLAERHLLAVVSFDLAVASDLKPDVFRYAVKSETTLLEKALRLSSSHVSITQEFNHHFWVRNHFFTGSTSL